MKMDIVSRAIRFARNPRPAIRRRVDLVKHKRNVARGNKKTRLDSEYRQHCPAEANHSFEGCATDIKAIALYLPQFHEFKENNEWWGQGFTEWTNVRKGSPLFEGHNQPRVPHEDIGYYDLSQEASVRKQVQLAKEHGIHAFGIYYYWFSGHRLMEKPMDIIYNNPDIDFPYFAIWANENFTRTWDGLEKNVLMAQEYSDEDPLIFIDSLKKYIEDERYMRVDGKPVIGLYNPQAIPNARQVLESWREQARKVGIGEITIWICITEGRHLWSEYYDLADAEYEFPPRGKGYVDAEYMPNEGSAHNYMRLVEGARCFPVEPFDVLTPAFRGTMMEWDNSARRQSKYGMWKNYSPFRFYVWNRIAISYLRANFDEEHRYLFINAWNEWGEGTYLEPDERYGYANINALSRAICDLPYAEGAQLIQYVGAYREPDADSAELKVDPKIAVHAHIYYEDLAEEFAGYLNHMPCAFDLFVTTDSEEKAERLRQVLADVEQVGRLEIEAVGNHGRDVMPFLAQMRRVIDDYDLVCHIHTKKSLYDEYGKDWRSYLLQNVMGSKDAITDILNLFASDEKLGVVFPQTFHVVEKNIEWGSNREIAEQALKLVGVEAELPDDVVFPAGNMHWVRTEAVREIFDAKLESLYSPEDDEKIDGTVMHAVERLWLYVAAAHGYGYKVTRNLLDDFDLEELKRHDL